MAEQSQAAAGGLLDSLKTLSVSLISIVQTRLDLLATDVDEERERLTTLLLLALVALFCLGVGIVLLVMLVVVALWELHRFAALGGLIVFFLSAGVAVGWFARHKLHTKPRLFGSTLAELSKDRQQLTSGS